MGGLRYWIDTDPWSVEQGLELEVSDSKGLHIGVYSMSHRAWDAFATPMWPDEMAQSKEDVPRFIEISETEAYILTGGNLWRGG